MKNIYSILLCLFLTSFCQKLYAKVIRVATNSPCSGQCDGSTWEYAIKDLQEALKIVQKGDAIWVAKGVYVPHSTDRDVSFILSDGIQLYGGFSGTEHLLEERSFDDNETILSGDIGQKGVFDDNSYTVLLTRNVGVSTIIDGFTVADGNANNTWSKVIRRSGGGWVNQSTIGGQASPTVRNCIFKQNFAKNDGGAIYNDPSNGVGNLYLYNCQFLNNQAKNGGAVYNNGNNTNCNINFLNCSFVLNVADTLSYLKGTGGAIYNFTTGNGKVNADFTNCLFYGNKAFNGGAFYSLAAKGSVRSKITNCTFVKNQANIGGTIYLNENYGQVSEADVANCIFWGSKAHYDRFFHFSGNGSAKLNLSYSLVDELECGALTPINSALNCSWWTMIFNEDPKFRNASLADFHITNDSPAIDAGDNDIINQLGIFEDFEGQERVQGSNIDLGMDEAENGLPGKAFPKKYKFPNDKRLEDGLVLPLRGGSTNWAKITRRRGRIQLFPVPANDVLNIRLKLEDLDAKTIHFSILDSFGRVVQKETIPYQEKMSIRLPDSIVRGLYFLKIHENGMALKFLVDKS